MAFVNRKQFYSINVQAVCDSDAFITNIVARWPGSTHDSRNFENSKIVDKLRNGALEGILVGDSRCACRMRQRMQKCATILHRNPNITVATCFYNCDALSLRNDTIYICFFLCMHTEEDN